MTTSLLMGARGARLLSLYLLLAGQVAHAQSPSVGVDARTTQASPSNTQRARALFKTGVKHVQAAEWSPALAAFERSHALRPHAVTTFNIGACQRALGRYTRAARAFAAALEQERLEAGQLAPSLKADAQAFVAELVSSLVLVQMSVAPVGTTLSVDGRPLVASAKLAGKYVANIAPPGPGSATPSGPFDITLDPGVHIFTLRRTGYQDVLVRRQLRPGSVTNLRLELNRLPTRFVIEANVAGAIVTLNGEDLGPVPVNILRPAGTYELRVRKPHHKAYTARLSTQPGEHLVLKAELTRADLALTSKWWFWLTGAAVLAGSAYVTYAIVASDPAPPPYEGGSTGWVAQPLFTFGAQ